MLNVTLVGTGYVGLVTGTCLADLGHTVVCVDNDKAKIDTLQRSEIPFYEPGLEALVTDNVSAGRLRFTDDLATAVCGKTQILFFAVGTPMSADRPNADLQPLFEAANQAAALRSKGRDDGFAVFVVKSTVPVGTCRQLQMQIGRHLPADRFAVVSNPEFLREGSAIEDFVDPDRIVVGSSCLRATRLMRAVYAPLTRRGKVLLEVSSIETSELIKYGANVFLATKIGLINEFSRLCERVNADVHELAHAVGLDRRIGPSGLKAGPGFGGSCFPKDLRALAAMAAESDSAMPIAQAVIESNEFQKRSMVEKIARVFQGDLAGRCIAVLGLSFKAGTDDLRESPALTLVDSLIASGANIRAYDPAAGHRMRGRYNGLTITDTAAEAVRNADAVVIATEWPEFAALDWAAFRELMTSAIIIDLRNLLSAELMTDLGYDYVGLGRHDDLRPKTLPRPEVAASLPLVAGVDADIDAHLYDAGQMTGVA